MNNEDNSKNIIYLIGGAFGAVTGLVAAHMYTRSAEANRMPGHAARPPARLETGDMLKLGIALVALVRQISDLGARPSQ